MYYELRDANSVDSLAFPRSQNLFKAIDKNRDFSCIGCFRAPAEGDVQSEYIVVDVECDGIPPNNSSGILYRERLALRVSVDPMQLVDVLTLRKNFPTLMHQNHVMPGTPLSLCLYFEPVVSVFRTWTPEKFLRRIQWWLEKSAAGELHPADQPVEGLFFSSPYELVIPWNIDQLKKENRQLIITNKSSRVNGATFTLHLQTNQEEAKRKLKFIDLSIPPIVHGSIERHPDSLGTLVDILKKRQVDFIEKFREYLHEQIDARGVKVNKDDGKTTIILLRTPIQRHSSDEVEHTSYHAFLIQVGLFELGESMGILLKYENSYFCDGLLSSQPNFEWRNHPVLPMDVLRKNDRISARKQSGINDEELNKGAIIGAGSLGSALLNLWGRSGWGEWTVLDSDHIKPHNLSRHTAYAPHIGEYKANVVAHLNDVLSDGASVINPLVCDATNLTDDRVLKALKSADFVIDASTTLEYPRSISLKDDLPRHASVFITPNGNGAALLVENMQRSIRLHIIEAQYYRALITNDWGANHLSDHVGTFWSGAGCRDISVVMPYSRILAHSCTLAEQIQSFVKQEGALIKIWQRDSDSGTVSAYDIPCFPTRTIEFGELSLFIDSGVEGKLRNIRQQNLPNETGGVLLGYYDFNIRAVFIVDALPAPTDSKGTLVSFSRGVEGLLNVVQEATERTAGIVGYIGEWHSHPVGCSAMPSAEDLIQLSFLARKMSEDGVPAFSLIVGEDDICIFRGDI